MAALFKAKLDADRTVASMFAAHDTHATGMPASIFGT
jgi:hypothetical protein